MHDNQFHLFRTRRFWPLFVTQFLGAANDNLFKNALVILILYQVGNSAAADPQILVTAAAGIFILPFFLFSANAGQLADKYEKSKLVSWIKFFEICIMTGAVFGLYGSDVNILLGVLFLMGVQSAYFGPLKYSILPDHLAADELIGGNALIEAGTFLAILLGTIAGGLLILQVNGVMVIASGILGLAVIGWICSLFIPVSPPATPSLKININIIAETWNIVRLARARRDVFLSILGISWFWLVGATFLSQFPAFAKGVIGGDETVVTLFLTVFSVGIGLGSLLCNKILKGEISAKFVPFGALGMTLFILDLYGASSALPGPANLPIGFQAFLSDPASWRIVADLLGISISGGLFIVPLYAIMQSRSDPDKRSRIIAGNNILNAAFMVVGALAAAIMLNLNLSVPGVFLVLAVLNAGAAVYICALLPDALVKALLQSLLKLCYRVEVRGLENMAKAGDKAVIVVNHVSFLDAVLLAAYLPKKPTFAIDTYIARQWWVRPFLTLVNAFPMDPANPLAIKSLIKVVGEGHHCVIFPEGRITVTGALMKIYEGPGMIADKAGAPLVPVRIDGAQYTVFSRLKGKVRQRWFPKITITIQEPRTFDLGDELVGRVRRKRAGDKLHDIMTRLIFDTRKTNQTLFQGLLDARHIHGKKAIAVEDVERNPASYDRVVLGSLVLGYRLSHLCARGEYVGLMLPNSIAAAVTFFGLQAFGRVPAMLNFSTGAKNMISAVEVAELKTVLTSRRFVEMAKLEEVVAALGEHTKIIYMEDVKNKVNIIDKLFGLMMRPFADAFHRRQQISPDDAGVILFTSGSEGVPKGVVLSHHNLLANREQLASVIDFNPTDTVFNALPVFHSFGLTGGLLLPLLSGVRTFLYPSPLHYRIVPALVYDTNATVMFGTDTFLSGYARVAHAYDFYSLRYVFAGAEKVKDETRRVWSERFGLRILEGYGTTETSPVLAANTPMHYKAGSVGRMMPGIESRLEAVPGIEEGGRLIVKGPNIMKGYLLSDAPGHLQPPEGGEYDTGDIVEIDDEGFVTIKGRAKRFAKIAGEMVSLGAVEAMADQLWPDNQHAAVALPDPKKGEQVLLFSDNTKADRSDLSVFARENGIAELLVPKTVQVIDQVPVLGTGKTDYVAVQKIAEQSS
jgi:acyl-[acyl-carrier-protein]-phospholipid O-acyltransferase / long-chain-fatty-acid--[acyl-carrier-protein] ligase